MEWLTLGVALLAAVGVFFTFVAVVGVIRLPDLYTRTHAVSKSDTLGAGFSLAAAAVAAGTGVTAAKLVFLLVFLLITNPTAAHALARSGRKTGVRAEIQTTESNNENQGDER
ncbi:monovalent cation/H(+) antiporter subunit G [Haloarcula marina]|uniref:monovalent cation/H(+) antiporter subunit G n=1 Tax=Haloarcula marina TaxID=2961574 RepID=UPI0020B765D6|nr:monovalent cation/H(+) antiporter subunit G [Halomicroarcula marina]